MGYIGLVFAGAFVGTFVMLVAVDLIKKRYRAAAVAVGCWIAPLVLVLVLPGSDPGVAWPGPDFYALMLIGPIAVLIGFAVALWAAVRSSVPERRRSSSWYGHDRGGGISWY